MGNTSPCIGIGRFLTITAQLPSVTLICSMSIIVIESSGHTESIAIASDYMYVAYIRMSLMQHAA